jgi:hypothetical protein
MRILVARGEQIAFDQPHPVARIENIVLMLTNGFEPPQCIVPPAVQRHHALDRAFARWPIVEIEGSRRIGLHMLDAGEPQQAPQLARHDCHQSQTGQRCSNDSESAERHRPCQR